MKHSSNRNNKKEIICKRCKKIREVNTHGETVASYAKKSPYCRSCGAFNAIAKISKGWFKKGQLPHNKGFRGEFNGKTYDGLHDWVERNLGKPKKCIMCKTTKAKVFQWSNISGKYLANLTDWQRLCAKCHQRYDFEKFGARKEFYL